VQGATAIEYALVAGSIAVVIITAVNTLGQQVNTMFFQQIVAAMQ
jgi:Flp pilus assembly pilin Flp